MTRKRFLAGILLISCLTCVLTVWMMYSLSPRSKLVFTQIRVRQKYPDVKHKSTDEVGVEMLDSTRTPAVILDVRSKEEYDISHIKTARLIDTDLDPAIALAGVSKDAEIVVYCSVGYRSSDYARKLQLNQYNHVYNLDGSIFKWANEGRPLFDEYKQVTVVHPYNAEWGLLLQPQCRADLNAVKK